MLKILRLSYVPRTERYSNDAGVFDELHRQADVTFVDIVKLRQPAIINNEIARLIKNNNFDFIYKNFVGPSVDSLKLRPLHEYGIPVFVSSGDCHTRLTNQIYNDRANHHKFDVIIVNNKSTIEPFKDYFDRKMSYIWLPWSYNSAAHKDYGEAKEYEVCFPTGSLWRPTRVAFHDYLVKSPYKYIHLHSLPPADFARAINKCNIGISTCQRPDRLYYKKKFIGMTFNKYYEIPMSGALHIGQRGVDTEDMGFIDGENVVMYDTFEEFKDKLAFYNKNESERLKILEASIKHVKHMTYENRIKNFLEEAKKFI